MTVHVNAELYYDCDGECEYDTDEDGICDQLEVLAAPIR